ncbi:hypothetical protein HF325_003550 [Metschnikowia pulcherrima]|uniref:Uncharacterized protein n=1 Tax=Metschnikowia pulcherrima TaxID=27326 RepID=A0A8H7GRW0_9ASCO|nr:hypothetical protein HF325_003550 [Metschnikowia pulcherrima]
MPLSTLLQDLIAEVDEITEKDLHPKVDALVSAFVAYLKEPRYQNPLTLIELKKLFDAFYDDLNSLVFHIYTQLNTNKRQLLKRSEIFKLDPKQFDYLNAIANYSSSSVKLSKRSDPEALFQLRVFGFYKFLTILKTIELAHSKLFASSSSSDSTPLYEKVFKFDLRDIHFQKLLSEKIKILRQLRLPIQCFLESESQSESLAELLNLDENAKVTSEVFKNELAEFSSDEALVNFIQSKYLNTGELQFCLTNCEAVLYFLLNTPISDIAPKGFTIPADVLDNETFNLSLHEIIQKKYEGPDVINPKDLSKLLEDEFDDTSRSRSSSLFETITNAVSQSVNRSRSNSGVKTTDPFPKKELSSLTADFETSLKQFSGQTEPYGLSRVRNIFERIGLASHLQVKPVESDTEDLQDTVAMLDHTPEPNRSKRSQSLFDKLSPNLSRARSGSLENPGNSQAASLRRATLSSKFSNGMTEFMTKISSAANTAAGSSASIVATENSSRAVHASLSSVHSIEDPFEDAGYVGRNLLGPRSSSLQTMEKWFCNIPDNPPDETSVRHRSNTSISSKCFNTLESNYNEGSVFSASFGELTKFHFTDFESMTINDLKKLKCYYDQLCTELISEKTGLKSSKEFLPDDAKEIMSHTSS